MEKIETKIIKVNSKEPRKELVKEGANLIKKGKLVFFNGHMEKNFAHFR